MSPSTTEPFKLANHGKEIACVWENLLPAVLPDLERQFGQLHQVRSEPDDRGFSRIHLFPFKK